MHGLVPEGRDQPLWWTLRRPFRPLTYHAARAMFVRAGALLGANWSLHDLRHTAAYRMARDPAMPLTDVQWILGHAQLRPRRSIPPRQRGRIASVLAHHARRARPAPCRGAPAMRRSTGPESLEVLFGRPGPMTTAPGRRPSPAKAVPAGGLGPAAGTWRRCWTGSRRAGGAALGGHPAAAGACWPGCSPAVPAGMREPGQPERRRDPACWTGWRPAGRDLAGAVGSQRRRGGRRTGGLCTPGGSRTAPGPATITGRSVSRLGTGMILLSPVTCFRPGLTFLLTPTGRHLAAEMARTRDPEGFARLESLCETVPDEPRGHPGDPPDHHDHGGQGRPGRRHHRRRLPGVCDLHEPGYSSAARTGARTSTS